MRLSELKTGEKAYIVRLMGAVHSESESLKWDL